MESPQFVPSAELMGNSTVRVWLWSTELTSQIRYVAEYNHIYDVMKSLADGGGIYTLRFQPGTVLRGNLIHDVHRSAFAQGGAPNNGIFIDQGSKGFLFESNVVHKTSGETNASASGTAGREMPSKAMPRQSGLQQRQSAPARNHHTKA